MTDEDTPWGELEGLADRLRHASARLRLERSGVPDEHVLLAWEQLSESERNQWRDLARAALEVMT